ncbi:MAG: F420-dependent NADP oxidoreductase [Bacteroidota bacterium]
MKVVCIGSGNVATHLARGLKSAGHEIIQVWSRLPEHAEILAEELNAQAVTDLAELDVTAELYVIAVKDDAIPSVSASLKDIQGMVVHTSGATAMQVLEQNSHHGIFYPLQTFSKSRTIDFSRVPVCLEANSVETLTKLKKIAKELGSPVYEVDNERRKLLHLSAVFVCNFVNHLYTLGSELLEEHELDFDMLKPLIMETAEKVQVALPVNVQTGPAVRHDETTIFNHLELLGRNPQLMEIYQTLSKSIKKTHQ